MFAAPSELATEIRGAAATAEQSMWALRSDRGQLAGLRISPCHT